MKQQHIRLLPQRSRKNKVCIKAENVSFLLLLHSFLDSLILFFLYFFYTSYDYAIIMQYAVVIAGALWLLSSCRVMLFEQFVLTTVTNG